MRLVCPRICNSTFPNYAWYQIERRVTRFESILNLPERQPLVIFMIAVSSNPQARKRRDCCCHRLSNLTGPSLRRVLRLFSCIRIKW